MNAFKMRRIVRIWYISLISELPKRATCFYQHNPQ